MIAQRAEGWMDSRSSLGAAVLRRSNPFGPATRFLAEETGAETVEVALMLALFSLAAIVGVTATGTSTSGMWTTVDSFLAGLSVP